MKRTHFENSLEKGGWRRAGGGKVKIRVKVKVRVTVRIRVTVMFKVQYGQGQK